jgi:hypothetical protein
MIRRTATLVSTLAALLAFAAPVQAGSAGHKASSANWAGYAVSGPGVRFKRIASTWVQPGATCAAGERRYSAYWVGIGGFHSSANALEQIGTQANCSSKGQAFYSAWYELVPEASVHIPLAVRPGDKLSASVTVSGNTVKLYLANRTRGTHFARRVRAKHVDVTAAEWIAEAPSTCDSGGCHTLPLADFGAVSFAGAEATNTAGHAGPISDPAWSHTAIDLSPDAGLSVGTGLDVGALSGGAMPSGLAPSGDAFTVTYQEAPLPAPTPEPNPTPPPPPPPPPAAAPGSIPLP